MYESVPFTPPTIDASTTALAPASRPPGSPAHVVPRLHDDTLIRSSFI